MQQCSKLVDIALHLQSLKNCAPSTWTHWRRTLISFEVSRTSQFVQFTMMSGLCTPGERQVHWHWYSAATKHPPLSKWVKLCHSLTGNSLWSFSHETSTNEKTWLWWWLDQQNINNKEMTKEPKKEKLTKIKNQTKNLKVGIKRERRTWRTLWA